MNNTQLYLAIGVPLVVNVLGFTLVGIMLNWLHGDMKDLKGDVKILTAKVVEMDNDVTVIKDRLGLK